ncbi:MAG: peptidyl-prolyl cis-trans isomerase [Deltaproteobacteria bacterium]|nr:peptidyl-prolyl cis-trans isomerase [Deltaproteobacteria bacterium]MBW2393747.1 peptidyl-prolyl cis-trans isomerase [Deltaproteobacteria bacterium]
MSIQPSPERRPVVLLGLGAFLGVVVAAWGLLSTDPTVGALPNGAVARVNSTLILSEDHERLVEGLESDMRQAVSPEMRKRVLDRMIDEELLVQRGMELGLVESDRRVRANITSAMVRMVVVDVEDRPTEEDELRAFYAEEAPFFTQPGRLRVRQVFIRVRRGEDDQAGRARAEAARAAWVGGGSLADVRKAHGDVEVSPVPDALLPPTKLREYVGPTALRAVMEMSKGEISPPVRSGTGYHVFLLLDREEERVPSYEEVSELVRKEWVRRSGDRALRSYLDDLRARADVVLAESAP